MTQRIVKPKKKLPVVLVQCLNCKYAELHQWMQNPVISICSKKNGERFVASCHMRCALFAEHNPAVLNPTIIHHSKYD